MFNASETGFCHVLPEGGRNHQLHSAVRDASGKRSSLPGPGNTRWLGSTALVLVLLVIAKKAIGPTHAGKRKKQIVKGKEICYSS